MGRKKNTGESSLELLLDTMCNTFGGVMFIAIALVVLMSMMSSVDSSLLVPAEKLKALEAELATLLRQNETLDKALQKLENHPARKEIAEIMRLQKQLSAARIQEEMEKTRKALEEQNFLLRQNSFSQENARIRNAEKRRETLAKELKTLQERLEKIGKKSTSNSTFSMTFRIMEQSFDQPYLLIVSEDRIWKLGPERDPQTGDLKVCRECTSEKFMVDGRTAVVCRPVPGKGIPILQGGRVSPEVFALLAKVPEKRVPLFSLSRDSFRSFCILRSSLTKQKIRHGVNLAFDRDKSCSFQVVREQKSYWY